MSTPAGGCSRALTCAPVHAPTALQVIGDPPNEIRRGEAHLCDYPQTSQRCLFWVFPPFSRRRSGGGAAETFGGQKEEQPLLLWNANGKIRWLQPRV